jgi:hypothetical protein
MKIFLFPSKISETAQVYLQTPIYFLNGDNSPGVKRPGCEANDSTVFMES